jgi:hypothetical protein
MSFSKFGVALLTLAVVSAHGPPGTDIQSPSGHTLLKTGPYGSKLYKYNVENSVYGDAPLLIDLTAPTVWQQGYDSAYLLGQEYSNNYDNLMLALLGDEPLLTKVVNAFVDWQWNSYLSVQMPDEYKQELAGSFYFYFFFNQCRHAQFMLFLSF